MGGARPSRTRCARCSPATPPALHAGKANLVLLPFLGSSSVLLLDGPTHLRQRKLMLPPFHGKRMAGYEDDVRRIAREHIAAWPRDGALKLAPRLQAITLDVVLRVIFGVREHDAALGELRARLRRMMEGVMGGPSLLALLALGPRRTDELGVYRPILRPVDKLLLQQIAARRADPGDDVLSLLLAARDEDGSPMSDRELRDELVTLLVAGHETTATALAWTVERLIRTEGGWDRLRAGGEEYAEAAGKEALRLRPVLPVVLRHLQRDMTIAGHDLPAGTVVAPCISAGAPPPRDLPRAGALPARALPRPRAAGRDVHVDPVRRRRAPVHRRGLRDHGAARSSWPRWPPRWSSRPPGRRWSPPRAGRSRWCPRAAPRCS